MTDASSASDLAGARHLGHEVQAGEDAVAGRRVLAHDDVAGLLAAEREAALVHRLEHVAVADRGLRRRVMPCSAIARCRPRLLITVATSVSSDEHARAPSSTTARIAMIWSPSTTLPSRVDREAAVGVAVVGDADVGAVLEHGVRQRVEVRRADAVVDVEAVGVGADHGDLRAGVAERLGRDAGCRAVRAVEHDVQAVEAVRQRRRAGARRSGPRRRRTGGCGRRRRRWAAASAAPCACLDAVLDLVGELRCRRGRRT